MNGIYWMNRKNTDQYCQSESRAFCGMKNPGAFDT